MSALREKSSVAPIRVVDARAQAAVGEPPDAGVQDGGFTADSVLARRPVDGERVPIERRRQSTGIDPAAAALSPVRPPVSVVLVAALVFASLLWSNLSRVSLTISEVSSAGKLVADGTEHDITVAFKAPRAAVRGVEVRAVDGSGDEAPRVYDVAPDAAASGKVTVGAIAMPSEQPRRITYRYVLLGDEGVRSAPFDKTFEFAAAPPPAPLIAGILGLTGIPLLPDLNAGKPVERESARSVPQRSVSTVRRPTASAGCTRTTCGRIVATRAIETPQGVAGFFRRIFASDDRRERKAWEVVVRRDDGAMRIVTDATRWNPGSRVRIIGDRVLSPLPRSGPPSP